MESNPELNEKNSEMTNLALYKIGVFDDISKARHAVEDAIAAGVSRDDITMVAPDKDSANDVDIDDFSVHPSSDMYRGHIGGAIGGAVGGLCGSILMYAMERRGTFGSVEDELVAGALFGVSIGIVVGALVSYFLPGVSIRWFGKRIVPPKYSVRDTIRSTSAGAIGGMFGAFAGLIMSYVMGIPTLWYFIGMGFFAAASSIIVGGLVGAMSGRGLAPREVALWEDVTDDDQNVLVSIDCHQLRARMEQVDELLRRDGAMLIRTA